MRYFNFIVAITLTIVYAVGKIPPSEKYNLWLTNFIIPFALASNIILLIISLLLRKKSGLYYVIALLIGSNYLISTFGIKYFFKDQKITNDTFRVLNYNTNSLGGHYASPYSFANADSATSALRNWLLNQEADIQCYQEFINYPGNKDFDLVALFKQKSFYYYFSHDSITSNKSLIIGILIASKFPIIKSGDVISSKNGFNRVAYVDLKIGKDTVRVINVHLESMGLKQYHPVHTSDFESRKENAKIILRKLKVGVFERSKQIQHLAEFIETSPYPVICVGDFNDLPYSYSYQFMKKRLKNTFEEIGKGLGFTYNGNTLRVLRIDNQFYSPQLDAVKFETLNHIKFTDHFPLQGVYKINH